MGDGEVGGSTGDLGESGFVDVLKAADDSSRNFLRRPS